MRKLIAAVFVLLAFTGSSWAVNCSTAAQGTVFTAAQLNAHMADNGPPGNITPGCYRDMVASIPGTASNLLNLKQLGLPTGGDDTTAINNALASVLPASFTATAALVPAVTIATNAQTVTGTTPTVLHFASTTGVTVGQLVYGGNGLTVPAGATVVSFVANTSVTISTAVIATVNNGAPITFGPLLNVTAAVGGTIAPGQTISGTSVLPGTVVSSISTGTGAGSGGTGIYNVTPLITAAVSSETMTFQAPPTATIYAPAGVYKHSGDIILAYGCMIGDGPATHFQSTNVSGTSTNAIILSGTNPCLRNMSIDSLWTSTRQGTNDSGAVDIGSLTVPATGYLVEGLYINGSASVGIFNYGSNNGIIRHNFIYNTLADGIIHGGNTSFSEFGDVVEGNQIYNPGDDCISLDEYTGTDIHDIRITANYCENGQSRGITANGGYGDIISDNIIVNPTNTGFQAGASPGLAATSNVIFSHNQCINCSNTGAWIVGQSGQLSNNIIFDGNSFLNLNGHCFYVGGGSNLENGVTIINNQCVGVATTGSTGSGVFLQGVNNVTIKNNLFKNFQAMGVQSSSPFNTGYADIESNTCDKIGISSGQCFYMPTETLTAAIIRNNILYSDGTSSNGILTISGVANLMIDGNMGDVTTGSSVTGMTHGNYITAYGQGQVDGTATVTCTTGSPTSSYSSIRGVQTHC